MIARVRFSVAAPIITTAPIHLDALLTAVHPAMHNSGAVPTRGGSSKELKHAPLRMDKAIVDDIWVWCCTAADYVDASPYHDHICKRKDGIDYFYVDRQQTPRTGPGRDRMDTVYGVLCSSVQFWASMFDSSIYEFERICKRVHSIGGLRKMGYGEVTGYEISEAPGMTWQDCLVKDGIAMRSLPQEMVVEHCESRVQVRHPYWMADNMRPGVLAGSPATLRDEVHINADQRNPRDAESE